MSKDTVRLWVTIARGWRLPGSLAWLAVLFTVMQLGPNAVVLPEARPVVAIVASTSTLAGMVLALISLQLLHEPAPQLLVTAPLSRRLANPLRVLVFVAFGALGLIVLSSSPPTSVLNTVTALTGEGLLGAALLGFRLSWLIPTMHALASLTLGAVNRRTLAPWAWVAETTPSATTIAASCGLLALGVLMWTLKIAGPASAGLTQRPLLKDPRVTSRTPRWP